MSLTHAGIRSLYIATMMLLPACEYRQSAEQDETDPSFARGDYSTAEGSWTVREVNDRPSGDQPAIGIRLTGTELAVTSGSVSWNWNIMRHPDSISVGEMQPLPVCERGRTENELAFLDVLAKPSSIFIPGMGLKIVSANGEILATS